MPTPTIGREWSNPIALQAGDILQNDATVPIHIIASTGMNDPARLVLTHLMPFQFDKPVTIRARALVFGDRTVELNIVRGF